MRKDRISGIIAGAGIFVLILDSRTAISGASDGIELCIRSVIPSIFPFLVLSAILTNSLVGAKKSLFRPLSHILKIPAGSESIFLTGILGGYPTGALSVFRSWETGQLTRTDAQRMLAFCSNVGPSFLFGMLSSQFSNHWMLWALWGIQILSAFLTSLFFPGNNQQKHSELHTSPIAFTQSLKHAVQTMGFICGWVVLFRVFLAFCDRWILRYFPVEPQVSIYGVLELANGCCNLYLIESEGLRFVLCCGMLAFGGICVMMQTATVTGELGLSHYIKGKITQTGISLLLGTSVQILITGVYNWSILILFIGILFLLPAVFLIIFTKTKNRGRNCQLVGV